jgi:Zn-dependent protease/predicted transcriptional regulator
MDGAFTVGRIAGIPIRIHFTWVFILALMIWSLGAVEFPTAYPHWSQRAYWVSATAAALLLFVSVLLHELSHALVSVSRGIKVQSITLFIFGGVTQISEEARTPDAELGVAVVGPATSLVLGGILLAVGLGVGGPSEQVAAVINYLGSINIILGAFNLLPAFPLDGGRVLRAALWRRNNDLSRATVTATTVSRRIGILMIVGGVLATFVGAGFGGLWIAFIGWYIEGAARQTQQQAEGHDFLKGVRVRDAMRTDFRTVVPALPLAALVEEYIVGSHQRSFPVFGGGKLWGIVTLSDVAQVPRDRWQDVPVEQIMTPRERLKTTTADTPLEQVLGELQHVGVKQLIVLDEESERVVGLLSRADLMDFLQVRRLVYRGA